MCWKRSHQSNGSGSLFFLKIILWQVSCGHGRDFEEVSIIGGCYLVQGNKSMLSITFSCLLVIQYCPTSSESNRSPVNLIPWVNAVEEDRGRPQRCQLSFEISIKEETPWVLFTNIRFHSNPFPVDLQAGEVTSSKSFLLEKVSIVKSRGVKSPNPTFSRYQDPGKIQEPSV